MTTFLPITLPSSKYLFFWDKYRNHLEELIYGQNKQNRSHNLHKFQAQIDTKIEELVATKILILDFENDKSLDNLANSVDNSVEILLAFLVKIRRKLKNFKVIILTNDRENWENSSIFKTLTNSKLDWTLEIKTENKIDQNETHPDFLKSENLKNQQKICRKIALFYKIENRQVVYLNVFGEIEELKTNHQTSQNLYNLANKEEKVASSQNHNSNRQIDLSGDSVNSNLQKPVENQETNSKIIYQILAQTLEKLLIDTDLLMIYTGNSGELKKQLGLTLDIYLTFLTRDNILKNQKRIDGRRLDETRQILSQVGVLPHNHGSSLFSRGETQVLNVLTLGTTRDGQTLDDMENFNKEETKNYIHHYNFPSYSVGETGRYFGPGRREIGHGALAEKALLPVLPTVEKFPYTMRLVSECLGSNGSTSMASTCASTLSLLQGGVPITDSVAGVAMGLVLNN